MWVETHYYFKGHIFNNNNKIHAKKQRHSYTGKKKMKQLTERVNEMTLVGDILDKDFKWTKTKDAGTFSQCILYHITFDTKNQAMTSKEKLPTNIYYNMDGKTLNKILANWIKQHTKVIIPYD